MKNFMRLFVASILIAFYQPTAAQSLVVNEVLASNSAVNIDEDDSYQDWVELFNNTPNPINLAGYGLSDNPNILFKWVFPSVTINPGSYLIIWCSNKNRTIPGQPLHTNFAISADGETISLTNPDGIVIDFAPPTPMLANISFGRSPNGTGSFVFFQTPTPAAENIGAGYTGTLNPPQFSQNSGFFTTGFDLTISSEDEDVTILYTIDGSEPDENNLAGTTYSYKNQYPRLPGQEFGPFLSNTFETLTYTEPISIIDRSPLPNKISMISSTYDFVAPYLPDVPIFKSTVVRAKVIKPGAMASDVVTRNYFITPQGNNQFSLPVVSLSIDEDKLFEYNDGIYVAGKDFDTWRTNNPNQVPDWEIGNFARKGVTSEREANFSYFVDGNEVINQNIGIRIRGNYSRVYPSKSFNFYAKSEYGDNDMDYAFFSDRTDESYTRLSLKNSSGDFYHTNFRDPLNHELIKGLRVQTEAYQPTITFINGEFYGILSFREKYDDKFFKRVYNIDEDEIDVLENNAIEEEGDNVHYLQMINYVQNNSLANEENYDYIQTQMDTDNFQDYFISNIFFQNVDWPGNNIVYWRKRTAQFEPTAPYGSDGRWRWAIHDMDSTFGLSGGSIAINSLANATAVGGTSWPNPDWSTLLLRKLLENDEFKYEFITRFADVMNTYFHTDRILTRIEEMKTVIAPEMPRQYVRWKAPSSDYSWNYFLNKLILFSNERPEIQRGHIRDKFEIANDIDVTVDVSNDEHGFIKVNTIEIVPTIPGITANPYPWTGIYYSNIPVKLKAIAKTGYVFSHWEGASTSTEEEIIIDSADSFSVTAVFIPEGFSIEESEPIYFWMMNSALPNDAPIVSINSTFEVLTEGVLDFQSCLEGYPFTNAHPNWRKASMERRNSPTAINYIPEANNNLAFGASNMRGLQIKQPFQFEGLENAMLFNFSTEGYKDIIFSFAAKDENAADAIVVDYSISEGDPVWITTDLTETSLPLSSDFELFEVDFSAVSGSVNNPNFKVRLRFTGQNMTIDNGDRVTFNNFSVKGVQLPLQYPTPNVFTVGVEISPLIPTVTAVADSYSIEPTLPNGLSFDETTGIISGTPIELSSAINYTVTATNSGGSTSFVLSIEVIDVAPSSLTYSTPNVYIINEAISNLVPTISGGAVLNYSIEPSLQNGLSFDESIGIISGTPTELSAVTDYTVTATNSGGSTSFVLSIEVIDVAPSSLTYSTPNVYTINEAISNLVPTISGGAVLNYSIEPSLPNGLSFDESTGIISGTPTELSSATNYTVTAINSGGSTSFVLSIEVIDVAPSSLAYSTPNVYTINETITNLVPTISGGAVLDYSIEPTLPNGLSFDESTGIISGTPTELSSATNYTVTAINSGGSTSFVLSIEVIDVAPSSLAYSTPNVYTINETITNLVPTISGGAVLDYSIEPTLPNGLSFDETTGIISGTPTELSSATDYTVTATNSGGSTSFVLSIEVIDVAPSSLTYSTPNVYTINETITNLVPTISGGAVLDYSIEPTLPNGLSFDETTGIISGTPTELSSATDYTVTATNSGGSTSFILSIEVIDVAPSSLTYSTPNVYTINEAISNLVPTISGGAVLNYSIEPSLPNGLSFDESTGIISGTPTELSSATNYTVTATNSGGSTNFMLSIEVIEPLSIDDALKSGFVLYPNPFESSINVIHSFGRVNYTLYSLDGKLIRNGILDSSELVMPELPNGTYLLQLETEGKIQNFKIIKK
ncbi:putative Ig domain-containing protein [Flavobacterium azooxidireducens]|uniref:Ig domain-containing protein n=1 Tax=Flavobacterium azooxidireducens TaxID=1871076 RepID=A0ABY4KAS9_9FLAO|nr:putative Ig domain-containing protein [Flavobacterium azooxidireducens]UPQ77900.1 putative Ig domain-containing protein [Flavobacterium azooxidireducens]